MEIAVEDYKGNGQVSVVKLSGRVDSETAPELKSTLTRLVEANKNRIVLDLQQVKFLSSSGLSAIIATYQSVKKANGDLRLASPSDPVEVVLRTVGMMSMFDVYSSSEEAVASFGPASTV